MIGRWAIHGHAIVSADEHIADAEGRMPEALHNPADWKRFQAALDRATVVVLGRYSHELTPNPKRRPRLVLSRAVPALERRDEALWWNPDTVPLADVLAALAPAGVAAVVGGRLVFDYFLSAGYDEFHLVRSGRVALPGGTPLFSGIADGLNAADVLAAGGLAPGPVEALDAANDVSLTVWRPRA